MLAYDTLRTMSDAGYIVAAFPCRHEDRPAVMVNWMRHPTLDVLARCPDALVRARLAVHVLRASRRRYGVMV